MADENGKDIVDGTEDAAEGVVEKGKELAEDAVDSVKDVAGGAVDKAEDSVDAVKDVAGDAADSVKDAAGGAVDRAEDSVDAVKDVAGDAADSVKDAAGGAVDKAEDAVDAVKDVAGDAADSVKDAAGGAVDKAEDAVDAVKDVAGDAADSVKDAAGGAVDRAEDAVDAVKDVAGDAAGAVTGAAGAAADKAEDAVDAVKDVAGDAAGAVTGAAGAAADKVGDALGGVGDAFDGDGDSGSILRWLLPLLLLGLLLVLGFMFCSKPSGTTTGNTNEASTNTAGTEATGEAVESSVSVKAEDGKYAITGVVKDEATKANIKKEAETVWGAGNVDVSGLNVDANATDFKEGWWDGFKSLLPDLKDWKTGTISWAGGAIKTIGDIPGAVGDKIKSLFSGWGLPVSIAGVEDAARAANEKAMELLAGADSVEKVVEGMNASIINFASGSSEVPADAKPILEKAAEVLKAQKGDTQIEIGGHTDNTGNAEANMTLSAARAESVKKSLVALGVDEKMLTAKGYGQTVPKGDNETEDGRFQNRRIEYKVGGSSEAPATESSEASGDEKTDEANTSNPDS